MAEALDVQAALAAVPLTIREFAAPPASMKQASPMPFGRRCCSPRRAPSVATTAGARDAIFCARDPGLV